MCRITLSKPLRGDAHSSVSPRSIFIFDPNPSLAPAAERKKSPESVEISGLFVIVETGLEPATSGL